MPAKAKLYVGSVIVSGAIALLLSLAGSVWPAPTYYIIYLALVTAMSVVKLRLPGLTGTYSLNSLFLLYGLLNFDPAPTLIAAVVSALAQSLLNTRKRPSLVQIAFNIGNLNLSLWICFEASRFLLAHDVYRPAVLALVAALYFLINTGLVSGVLSLLEGRTLREVCREWYLWSFPYYAIGVAALGCVPAKGQPASSAAWLVMLPPLYFLHFILGIANVRGQATTAGEDRTGLSTGARAFFTAVIGSGGIAVVWAISNWSSADVPRFVALLALAAVTSCWKVRLPGMMGTMSVSFVVLLVAIVRLTFSEIVVIAAAIAIVQCYWKASRKVSPLQLSFNIATQVLSAGLAHWACYAWIRMTSDTSAMLLVVVVATILLYVPNSLLVSGALCAVQAKPLGEFWRNCYFWLLPYYMVGGTAAALMIATERAAGWVPAMTIMPMMTLVYISYRTHVVRASEPA
jgi:hypothetical protein